MDCHQLYFCPEKSERRINRALKVFPRRLLMRVLAFAFYLSGASRKAVATLVEMPEESVKTAIRVVMHDGFLAFSDRRLSKVQSNTNAPTPQSRTSVRRDGDRCIIDFGQNMKTLEIPITHPVQMRTVLLSLSNAGLLSAKEIALVMEISPEHSRELARKLASLDVAESLIDKRQGQKCYYRVGIEQRAEIIQQIAARAITGHSTTSKILAEQVNNQTKASLSARTIRWHISNLGLVNIKETLPHLVETLKKSS